MRKASGPLSRRPTVSKIAIILDARDTQPPHATAVQGTLPEPELLSAQRIPLAGLVLGEKSTCDSRPPLRPCGAGSSAACEHLVFSAHLDHLGVSAPINGDGLYNGALDNAAGVAGLLDIARSYRARRVKPRRSLLFVFVTAEEKGLLGSRYFALRPTVAKRSIVANLNFDMALPIFPLRSVIALGAEESSLGQVASQVSKATGLPLAPDPFPDRNNFVRSDQYSFIREGVPALAFKFGFGKGTPEAEIERSWRSNRYHAPSDDLSQPVDMLGAVRLHDYVAELGWRIANASEPPRWGSKSFFRRFASE